MSRNGSGVYTLPAGNPVVSGAVISSTTHNNTNTDIETALSDSLTKNGEAVISGTQDYNGNKLVLDTNGDTSITADTDDNIDFEVAGTDAVTFGWQSVADTGFVSVNPAAFTADATENTHRFAVLNSNAITIPAGTTALASTVYLTEPNLTATGTITKAATLYIESAPTEGTNNYSLWSDTGTNRLDGDVLLGAAADARHSVFGLNYSLNINSTGQDGLLASRFAANTSSNIITFLKSRDTSPGSFTTVAAGDRLGAIDFYGDDGTDYDTATASIVVAAEGTIAAGRVPTKMTFSTGTDAAPTVLTTALVIDSAQDVNVSTGNVVIATSGKGIDFSATADGSGTTASELFDDYEEGTFTPTLGAGAQGNADAYGTRAGRYTKQGNRVDFDIHMTTTDISSFTGGDAVVLGGLPFTAAAGTSTGGGVTVGAAGLNITAGETVSFVVGASATSGNLPIWDDAAGMTNLTAAEWTDDGQIIVTGSYQV